MILGNAMYIVCVACVCVYESLTILTAPFFLIFLAYLKMSDIETYRSDNLRVDCFANLDIPDLLINVWEYNDDDHKNCAICDHYEKWCVEIARSKWQPYFKAFSFVIAQIQIKNKNFFDFGNISSADKNYIYQVIWKRTF